MKESIKDILKQLNLYHPLQSFYRNTIFKIRLAKSRTAYKKYEGAGYTCNVCGKNYQKFVPEYAAAVNKNALEKNNVIAGYGENVYCPNCFSSARERLVIAYLKKYIDISDKKILHLSPENNIYNFLKQNATVVTADLLPGFYKSVDRTIQHEDATILSFADNSFDIVIANHILEHIPDDKMAMKEILRVLKPVGKAILQVPYSSTLSATIEDPFIHDEKKQSEMFGQKDHVRIYALKDYIKRLEQTGFHVDTLSGKEIGGIAETSFQPGEVFFKITKPARV